VEAYLQNLQFSNILDKKSPASEINMTLPASLRTNIDWHISKYFFVNADALVSFRSARSNSTSANYVSTFNITPRFESKWLSIYSPLSVNVYDEFNWGAGLRIGPLFIGSASVLSNAFKTNFSNMDAHVGLSVPVYQGKRTKRKKLPVSVENIIAAPPVIQQPVTVKPKDSLAAVSVETPRPAESDIKVQAPEVKAEIKKVVDKAAKNLFFSFGSASIDARSFPFLDELATLLNDEPNLLVAIEGHTDNIGSDLNNRRLSLDRAEAAKGYLVNKDVNPLSITTHGFGSTLPVSTNATETGRAQNRRIVIRVRNW
jgi:outer membrane protein OmpA-like peptidoglycan-associated protein